MSDHMIGSFDGRYCRDGRIWLGVGKCSICGLQDTPVIGMNPSGCGAYDCEHDGDSHDWYEYASGYICRSCANVAFKEQENK